MESMLVRILEGQHKQAVEFSKNMDAMYTDLNENFEALNTHVKNLKLRLHRLLSL